MGKGMRFSSMCLGTFALAFASGAAYALGPITVPNFSFENPAPPPVTPFASPFIDNWQKPANPDYFLSSGIFFNVDGDDVDTSPDVDNADGTGLGFIFSAPGNELYQTLTGQQFQVGEAYQLTIGAEGGGASMALGEPLLLRLYYIDPTIVVGDNRVVMGTTTILNNNPPNQTIRHLDDHTLLTGVVQASDAWAGRTMGIQIASPLSAVGGYWDLDNVRLVAVPEPGAAALLSLAGLLAMRRRRA